MADAVIVHAMGDEHAMSDKHARLLTSQTLRAASSLHTMSNASQLITFGDIEATGNAVLRLEVDEIELVSGDWNLTGFSIPLCGE